MLQPTVRPKPEFRLAGRAVFAILAVGFLIESAFPQAANPSAGIDVTPRQLTPIAPGTVIDHQAPRGWSHLIIKSQPRVGAGDVQKVTNQVNQLSCLLFTAVVANVQEDRSGGPSRYRLTGLGVGMGTKIRGKDVIITPETQRKLGADLGFFGRIVLNESTKRIQEVLTVARSDGMALIDAPALMLREGKHRPIIVRYALLVDGQTGRLDTLIWPIDRDDRGAYVGLAGDYEWLAPNKLEDCMLHVDGNEFFAGTPTESAFAMNCFPRGQRQIAIPDGHKALAVKARLSREAAVELEAKLRDFLAKAGK